MGTLKNELVLLQEDTQDSPGSLGKWLRIGASTAEGMGSIPGWETKITHHMPWDESKKKKKIHKRTSSLSLLHMST